LRVPAGNGLGLASLEFRESQGFPKRKRECVRWTN
jgi:hypothetical protein